MARLTRAPATRALDAWVLTLLVILPAAVLASSAGATAGDTTAMTAKPAPAATLEQDPWQGSLWLGTEVGLFNRDLDTGTIQYYGPRAGLPGPGVLDISPAPESVWLGTTQGPAVLHRANHSIDPISTSDGQPLTNVTKSVHVGPDAIWVGTDTAGLFEVDPDTLTAEPVPNPVNGSEFEHPILGVGTDDRTVFLSVTGYGLVVWDRDTGEATRHKQHALRDRPLYGRLVHTDEDVWIGTSGDGVAVLDRSTGNMTQHASPDTTGALHIEDLVTLGPEIWMATATGVSRYDSVGDSWDQWKTDSGFSWGPARSIAVVDGKLHVTTKHGNLVSFDRSDREWRVPAWWEALEVPPHNLVNDCKRQGSNILAATAGGSAAYYQPGSGTWSSIDPVWEDRQVVSGPPDILVRGVAIDDREAWYATSRGAGWEDLATGAWSYHRTDDRPLTERRVPNEGTDVALSEDMAYLTTSTAHVPKFRGTEMFNGSARWVAGSLSVMDRATEEWTRYNTSNSAIASNNVSRVLPDGNRTWVGFFDAGLDVYDPENGTFTHVYSATGREGSVFSLEIGSESLWVGSGQGLLRIDPQSHAVSPVSGLPNVSVTSLAWNDPMLWVGTAGAGVHALDPVTGAVTPYTTGESLDLTALCILPMDDTVYVGSHWGLDRLSLSTGEWLPKVLTPGTGDGTSGEGMFHLAQPRANETLDPSHVLNVSGTATAPNGSYIQVRVGDTLWRNATGLATWSATIPSSHLHPGPGLLEVRLRSNDTTLAQTARPIHVLSGGGGAGAATEGDGPRIKFSPFLETYVDRNETLKVTVQPVPDDLGGTLNLRLPGQETSRAVPLDHVGEGTLVARTPTFEQVGLGSYTLNVSWEDGYRHLPGPGSAFGDNYEFIVYGVSGQPSAHIFGLDDRVTAEPGTDVNLSLTIQNTGERAGTFLLEGGGSAAPWIRGLPSSLDISATSSEPVTLTLTVPEDAATAEHELSIHARPEGGGGAADARATVAISPAVDDTGQQLSVPGPAAILGLALVATTALLDSRRRRE